MRACLESVSRHCGDCEIHVLDDRTLHEYVTIPPHILQHLQHGSMSRAHFSDYLRTCLLLQYGGIWLDATVYLSDPLPAAIREARFFIYKSSLFHSFAGRLPPQELLTAPIDQFYTPWHRLCGSSWCMAAAARTLILARVKAVLEAYWQRESRLMDYFLFHHILTWLLYRDRTSAEFFLRMPSLCNLPPHLMQSQLLRPYDARLDTAIRASSSVHKLTHKFEAAPGAAGLTLHHLLAER